MPPSGCPPLPFGLLPKSCPRVISLFLSTRPCPTSDQTSDWLLCFCPIFINLKYLWDISCDQFCFVHSSLFGVHPNSLSFYFLQNIFTSCPEYRFDLFGLSSSPSIYFWVLWTSEFFIVSPSLVPCHARKRDPNLSTYYFYWEISHEEPNIGFQVKELSISTKSGCPISTSLK